MLSCMAQSHDMFDGPENLTISKSQLHPASLYLFSKVVYMYKFPIEHSMWVVIWQIYSCIIQKAVLPSQAAKASLMSLTACFTTEEVLHSHIL